MLNMTQLIRNSLLLLFTEECLDEYFDDLNFFHGKHLNL